MAWSETIYADIFQASNQNAKVLCFFEIVWYNIYNSLCQFSLRENDYVIEEKKVSTKLFIVYHAMSLGLDIITFRSVETRKVSPRIDSFIIRPFFIILTPIICNI